jgi:thioredoxin-like negative regulator of GroEL
MAENLFRAGDIDAAHRAFRLIDQTLLSREDRAFVNYMIACCLRRMNRRSEAAVIYRSVAEAREDEFIAGCAVSQLTLIRTAQELEAQLEQLRARP